MEKANLRVLNENNPLLTALEEVKALKPNDKSSRDRYFAIVITQLETTLAVFEKYCLQETENE